MQAGVREGCGDSDTWAFGGVDLQSLQAELAAAQLEKQSLLAQASTTPSSIDQKDGQFSPADTPAAGSVPLRSSLQPPKAPTAPSRAASTSSKQPPLRSLSWANGSKAPVKQQLQPQRRSTFTAYQHVAQPDRLEQHTQQHQQPVQKGAQQAEIDAWLSQEQLQSSPATSATDSEAVRQQVLQEVLQAVAVQKSTAYRVDFNSLTVKAVADIAKQQIVDASEAAQKEKEAAVTKGMQSVQRRASKEALIQADQVVAKAQQAAAQTAERSQEEAAQLRRELEIVRKEKRALVQRCSSADSDRVSSVIAQEQLQQQVSNVKAACKAADSSRVQLETQYQKQLADLMQQLATAKQQSTDLVVQHQQELATLTAATAAEHQQEVAILQAQYADSSSKQSSAVAQLKQEVAATSAQAEEDMTAVMQSLAGLQQASCHEQAELGQQLALLTAEVAALQDESSSGGTTGEDVRLPMTETLTGLVGIQRQLAQEGCLGFEGLMQEHAQFRAQVSISTQQCSELQQRLQDQQAEHESNSSDMGRMVSKVHGLEFDLGNLRQSLQAKGGECQRLQLKLEELQHEIDCVQAQHAKDMSSTVSHQRGLREQVQQHDTAVQQLQRQLYVAVQLLEHMQQQAHAQGVKAYKSAVTSSVERLQELRDRYFQSTPAAGGKQAGSNVLKLEREHVVSAYAEFQQRRGGLGLQSASTVPAAGGSSPSSSLRQGAWGSSSLGIIQQPLLHVSSHLDSPGRGWSLNPSSRFMDSRKSFAAPATPTSSSAAQGQGFVDQPFSPRQSTAASSSSHTFLQRDLSMSMMHIQHEGHSSADTVLDISKWTIPDVQPEPSWLMPFMQPLMQFEACLLNALTGLLTQGPSVSDDQGGPGAERKRKGQAAAVRQQVWPKAAEDRQQKAEDTTGEMVRAMSSQKRDLARRLKAAESSNTRLRAELQDFRANQRWGSSPTPMTTRCSASTAATAAAVADRPSHEVRGSWQEMAAVLDMLQDISIPSENLQLDGSDTDRSASVSPDRRKPRCASAIIPSSSSKAGLKHPRCSSALSPGSPSRSRLLDSLSPRQQGGLYPPCLPGPFRSPIPSKGKLKGSPLSVSAKNRQDWQS